MQLHNLIQPIENQTDEELRARLVEIRRRRETEKPKAARAVKKAEKQDGKKKVSAAEKLLAELTPEQLEILMAQLGETK